MTALPFTLDLAAGLLIRLVLSPSGEVLSAGLARETAFGLARLGLAVVSLDGQDLRGTATAAGHARVGEYVQLLTNLSLGFNLSLRERERLMEADLLKMVEMERGLQPRITTLGYSLLRWDADRSVGASRAVSP